MKAGGEAPAASPSSRAAAVDGDDVTMREASLLLQFLLGGSS